MKFSHVTIMVKNLDESLAFYQDIIGLSLQNRMQTGPDGEIAFLGDGDTMRLELAYNKTKGSPVYDENFFIGFMINSMDETVGFLKAKGIESSDIVPLKPPARCIFITDPNGIKLQLLSMK